MTSGDTNTADPSLHSAVGFFLLVRVVLLAIIVGPIGIATLLVIANFNRIKAVIASVVNWIVGTWNSLVGYFSRVAGALGGMWDSIWNGFKSAADLVIRGWDALHLSVGGWKIGHDPFSITLPTITVGLPYIPPLQTGGLITSAGVAYLHAGETVTPAGRGRGPAIHIENAQFMEPVDVDVLEQRLVAAMRRAS